MDDRKSPSPMIVDLGCGSAKRGNVGIDLTAVGTKADIICNLGFEPIPLPDSVADRVLAYDFLEHMPFCVWENGKRRTPVIDLFNEVWRILKPDGIFESLTPCYPARECYQDPTHVSVWTMKTMSYFSDFIVPQYGIRARFRVLRNEVEGSHLASELQAVK